MSASNLSDESLLRFYDNIRAQVEAERTSKTKFMTAESIKEYAEKLRLEMFKRRLQFTPIDGWTGQHPETVVQSGKKESTELSRLDGNDASTVPQRKVASSIAEKEVGGRDPIEDLSENLRRSIDALMKKSGT